MKNRSIWITGSIVVVLALLLGIFGCAQGTSTTTSQTTTTQTTTQKPYVVNVSLVIPPTINRAPKVYLPWADQITKDTGGRVTFVWHYANELASSPEMYDALLKGLFEIGECSFSYTPGRAPYLDMLNQIPNLAGLPPTAGAYTKAYWDVYKKFPEVQAEWKDSHLLFNFPVPLFEPMFRTPKYTLADIKNVKVEDNGHTPSVTALGMVPVSVPTSGEIYLAVQSGMVDGATESPVTLIAFKLGEYLKFLINNFSVGDTYLGFAMNKDFYNSLPKDIQAVFDKYSGDYLLSKYVDFVDPDLQAQIQLAQKNYGVQVYSLPADELARWNAAIAPVTENVLTKLQSAGATKVRDVYAEYQAFAKTLQ